MTSTDESTFDALVAPWQALHQCKAGHKGRPQ